MAGATGEAREAGFRARMDVLSVPFLLAGVGLIALAVVLAQAAVGFFGSISSPQLVIDKRIKVGIQGILLSLIAAFSGLYGYRFLRMMDTDWRREFLRLSAPKVREFRHTAHMIRKSPLTLAGIVIIAIFAVMAVLAAVAPTLITPFPQDGGAIYYRGELFQPPFQRTQVWRNETFGQEYFVSPGWVAWTDAERDIIPFPHALRDDPVNVTREAEPPSFSANVARSNLTGESFVVGGFRLDDIYTPDIGFVGVVIRQRVAPANHLAVSLSWDREASWSAPVVTGSANFTRAYWGETLDFSSVTNWTPAKLSTANFRLRMEHVTDAGAPQGPAKIDYFSVRVFFQGKYTILGTDELGRDYFSRIVLAAPLDLLIAVVVVASALLIGVVLGVVSGYYGGWIDEAIMRITDIFLSIPGLILALAFTAALGPGLLNIMTALVITWWPGYTRLIRGQTLSIRENLYVEAARAVGVPSGRIILRHVLPNSFAPVLVNSTLDMGAVILVASALSFLGLGVQPPEPEWGAMVSDGRFYIIAQGWWWLSAFPGLAILFASLGFNLAGDGLRDILDPRLRR
jgi:peptide/nickel transport system permease protein